MSAIPYTVERHPETGVNNVQLGMWLFIASEVMLFGGLFSAYFMLRAGAPAPWQPLWSHLGRAGINTVLLLAAGALLVSARKKGTAALSETGTAALSKKGTAALFSPRLRILVSTFFALAFCLSKATEYVAFAAEGLPPAVSTQMSTYYLLTGVHVLHVAGGVVANLWVASTAGRLTPAVANRLDAAMLYWVFVDAIWLLLVVVLYVV